MKPLITSTKPFRTLSKTCRTIGGNFEKKMNFKMKVVIVDDDKINAQVVKTLVSQHFPQLEIVALAHTIEDAIISINIHEPELLLLDINIGDREIFEIFKEIHTNAHIVFISSESNYAIKAFRYDATDFVLKPIESKILISAISKAVKRIIDQSQSRDLQYFTFPSIKNFITISSIDRHEIVKVKDIKFCTSDGRYTNFNLTDGRVIMATKNLAEFEIILEKHPFFIRISRSQIINFEHVMRVNKKDGMYCVFYDGVTVPVARRKYLELNKFLTSIDFTISNPKY